MRNAQTSLTWLDGKVQYLVDGGDLLVWRGVEHDDDGADQAYGAPQLAQPAQDLVQEVRPQHGADQHGEGA